VTDLVAGSLELTLGHRPSSVQLIAAHLKVVSMLVGDDDVETGVMAAQPYVDTISLGDGTWNELLDAAAAVMAGTRLRRQGETAYWAGGDGKRLPSGAMLSASVRGATLRLRFDPRQLDDARAARIAGYYRRILELIHETRHASHHAECLLSPDELAEQTRIATGTVRSLPDCRFHELFEQQAERHPEAVAVVCGTDSRTYAEVNRQANRLARALRTRGGSLESVVAVVMDRNADWMVAVLAILKAGGVYLPIEPQFPPDRIARMLRTSRCRLALAERAMTSDVDAEVHLFADLAGAEADDSNLGLAIPPSALAYVYFTSGSTGEPKGAMCQHDGMLNHLFAKLHDFEVQPGETIAQVAPQCFDISLWQLLSATLVRGRTLIVPQETVMDADRFLELVRTEADVVQLVPSYLELLLARLGECGGDLGRVRLVSATGEALPWHLAQRWFAAMPARTLANAYGLTETSDDTNHEVIRALPGDERIALGRPVNNVTVRVLDRHLHPVPLGAPGEIVVSGMCVGRGYINNPALTASSFTPDPTTAGSRLYRSGDFGRLLPDGRLLFLGRRDAQVKVRGFRIEIGEIEHALLGVAGVREAAVMVGHGTDGSAYLAAFYTAAHEVEGLRQRLAEVVPAYMVPHHLELLNALPQSGNGKVDKKALGRLLADHALEVVPAGEPSTETERRLIRAWSQALEIGPDRLNRDSHFFDAGGTSLAAIRLALALDREIGHAEVLRFPVLADLAAFIDRSSRSEEHVDVR
jgi:amino acid adenylation domain-containing protein